MHAFVMGDVNQPIGHLMTFFEYPSVAGGRGRPINNVKGAPNYQFCSGRRNP